MKHKWLDKSILHPDHAKDLEQESANLELGSAKLGRGEAEEAAHKAYTRKHHAEAIAYHGKAMRQALSKGKTKIAEQHSSFYENHMKALGLRFSASPPACDNIKDTPEFDKYSNEFKPHPADQLLVAKRK